MAEAARTEAPPAPKPPEHAPKPAKPKPKPPPHTSSGKPARQPAPPLPEPAAEPDGKKKGAAPSPPAPPRPPARLAPAGGTGGGLPGPVATAISGSLGVDVSPVRVHTDANAAEAARMLGARAVTAGPNVLLGRGEHPTDLPLMAHEVAHTVQQRGAPRVQLWSRSGGDSYEQEAQRASAAVVAGRPFTVVQRTPPRLQRWGISDVLDWFADKANNIPGYRMFTIIIGVNPINGAKVERSGANILRAAVEFMPGGHLIVEALEKYGIFEKGGAWLEQQVKTLGMTGGMFIDALKEFVDSLGWTDILHPGRVWDRAKAIFTAPIKRLIDFFVGVVVGILKLIKDAILKPLAALASKTPAWDLLLAVLGKNPITDEPVKADPGAVIGGFMKLIGQEELWQNIQRAHALPRAWAWFKGALAGLLAFVRQIPGLFVAALRSLTIEDIVILPKAFIKVGKVFAGFAIKFVTWAFQQVLGLLQIIFEVVAPGAVPYIRKAAGAFNQILRAPAAFLGNLVRAGRLGFDSFRKNFLAHLRKSIIDWLTGSLAGTGVYIPQAFELKEIVKFVLSVLGLTWDNVRGKLVRAVGEPVVKALEGGFDIVVTLVKEGPAAAWEKIKESLSNLKDMVMSQILDWVKGTIVEIAISKILSFLSPVGAFIQAIIGIYRTVMFFVQRLRQIAMVVASFIDSIAAIAAGAVGSAAARVETTLAGFLTTVISFLANFIGLGGVGERVKKIIASIRAPIDKALDKVIDWIVSMARKAGRFFAQAGTPKDPAQKLEQGLAAATAAVNALSGPTLAAGLIRPVLGAIKVRYGFKTLEPVTEGNDWWVEGELNPKGKKKTTKKTAAATAPGAPAPAAWPVQVQADIRIPESSRIEKVLALNPNDTITYSASGGQVTTTRANFTRLWTAGTIRLASGASAEETRARLVGLYGQRVADAIMRRGDLASNAGILDARQAHHIIPVELLEKSGMLRLLVQSGWDFNQAANGVPLAAGFHGNHPKYTEYVNKQINAWVAQHGASKPADFQAWVEGTLLPSLRGLIADAHAKGATSGENLNDYFAKLV